MKSLRLYCDTSVIGGYFDKEFDTYSKPFIDTFIAGHYKLLISEVVIRELSHGPKQLIELLKTIPQEHIELIELNNEIVKLSQCYLEERIISEKYMDDALHVAAATISRADAIVSWNFKHIVRLDKIKQYNLVNFKNGYGLISIITPMELNYDFEE